jgi:hypothetical protein
MADHLNEFSLSSSGGEGKGEEAVSLIRTRSLAVLAGEPNPCDMKLA